MTKDHSSGNHNTTLSFICVGCACSVVTRLKHWAESNPPARRVHFHQGVKDSLCLVGLCIGSGQSSQEENVVIVQGNSTRSRPCGGQLIVWPLLPSTRPGEALHSIQLLERSCLIQIFSTKGPDVATGSNSSMEGPSKTQTEGLLPLVCVHGGKCPTSAVHPQEGRGNDRIKVLATTEQETA